MGVHGLWKILEPAHRPVKLEALAKKRLAVDASIWIYQFLKAVRDQEGDALQNSHLVGFFRRICKLLFHGIWPVFVFDGGAPVLKRQTIAGRKQRREGRREDATRTAQRLLALQVKKAAEGERERRARAATREDEETVEINESTVYVDELELSAQQRAQNRERRKRKTDQYQLPELEHDLSELGAPNDVRLMTTEELREYAKEFEGTEAASFEDFVDMDFSSPFFQSLPAADRYRILNAARLRSRLRMGYSKEQLDAMFPDRMEFSRFQIERLAKRNELSQRLLSLQSGDAAFTVNRVAGEKGKEYVLVRNEGKDGGWVMSFVGQKGEIEGDRSRPVDLDAEKKDDDEQEISDDDDFEDVPIEGLNRLPAASNRVPALDGLQSEEARQLRQALYESRWSDARRLNRSMDGYMSKTDALMDGYKSKPGAFKEDALFLGSGDAVDPADEEQDTNERDERMDEDLQDAIALSLGGNFRPVDNEDEDLQRAIAMSTGNQEAAPSKGKQPAFEIAFTLQNEDQAAVDFNSAVEESRQLNLPKPRGESSGANSGSAPAKLPGLKPLNLNASSSFLFSKKPAAASSGGKKVDGQLEKSIPLPPWFAKDKQEGVTTGLKKTDESEHKDRRERERVLGKEPSQSKEVINLGDDVETAAPSKAQGETVSDVAGPRDDPPKLTSPPKLLVSSVPDGASAAQNDSDEEIEWDESDAEIAPQPPKATTPPSLPSTPVINTPNLTQTPPRAAPSSPPLEHNSSPPPPIDPDDLDAFDHSDHAISLTLEDAEEQELLLQMARENAEHARFAASLEPPVSSPHINTDVPEPSAAEQQAQSLVDYQNELKSLRAQHKKDRRDADEVSQVMVQECQQLLTLFGLPYITAPMEAEAQCAELVRLGLVDGIVTDDSDVFLFGGNRVFRYMFNDKQVVQCYLTSDLESEFSLDQNRLIAIAQLLGSDYTDGIPGVGPVTAVELLADFNSSLSEFKSWFRKVQSGTAKPEDTATPFRRKFARNAHKIALSATFPDSRVEEAYLHPEVDSDPQPFEWGVPDLDGLRELLMTTLNWSTEFTNRTLLPVVRDMNHKQAEGAQTNITRWFEGSVGAGAWAPRVRGPAGSKRMEQAMAKLAGSKGDGENEESRGRGKEKRKPMSMREMAELREKETRASTEGEAEDEELEEQPKKRRKASTRGKKGGMQPTKRGKRVKKAA